MEPNSLHFRESSAKLINSQPFKDHLLDTCEELAMWRATVLTSPP